MFYVIVISLQDVEKFNSYEEACELYERLLLNGFDVVDVVLTKEVISSSSEKAS